MPGSDTSDLTATFMGLARQLLGMPARSDSLESFTLGDTNDVDHFILAKDTFDWHFLFKVFTSKVDLVGNGTAIELDLDNVSLLLASPQQLLLGVAKHTNNLAIFLDLLLSNLVFPFKTGLGKSLLLRFRPILVEATFTFNIDVLGPNGL